MFDTSHYIIGSDITPSLLQITRDRGGETVLAGISVLPFREESADFLICIAVIHHLSTPERRQEAIEQCVLSLVKGGRCLLYVWAFEQQDKMKKFKSETEQDVMVGCTVFLKVLTKKGKLPKQIYAKKDTLAHTEEDETDVTYQRYYHLFKEGELEALVDTKLGIIVERGYDRDNWWCVVERV